MSDYPLSSLFLYLTDHCNLRCSHCWISPHHSTKEDSGILLDLLKRTIIEAKTIGLNTVKLTGGEPLLYRNIEALLFFLKDEDLTVSIETNGTLIGKGSADVFRDGGVNQVAVSLDAASEKIHDELRGVQGSFEKTVEGIKQLSEKDLNVQIITTLQKKNSAELFELLKLCERLSVTSIKINHLLPFGRATNAFRRGENLELNDLMELQQWVYDNQDHFPDLNIIFDLPVAFRSIDEIKQKGICECQVHNILGILASGEYCICGIGQTHPDLRMGNIRSDSISDVWENSSILKELRESLPSKLSGICGNCIFKFQCLGCCRANAYAVSGNLYAPYFLCQSLYDEKQFPESRCMNMNI